MSLRGKRVLDVGCGSGGVCIAFAKRGAICTGVEPGSQRYEWAITRVRDHKVSVDLRHASLETAGLAKGSFDVILAIDVLEHVDDYREVTRQICDLLANGGIFLATVPNAFHIQNIISDNHFGLFGVSLLPRKLRAFYVVKVRKAANTCCVTAFPPCHKLAGICRSNGLEILSPAVFRKLQHPETFVRRHVRALMRVPFLNALAARMATWFMLPDGFVFAARKTANGSDRRETAT